MALKHGFRTVEQYKVNVQKKFSLLENGILEKPSARLLLVNVSEAERICHGMS
jgi:hypothetical protein